LIRRCSIREGRYLSQRRSLGATANAEAINKAERFHKEIISNYYHPNTYAFYGRDADQLSYGTVRWAGTWHRAGRHG
jgi:hypothetical protein